jgi:hypothetical protein
MIACQKIPFVCYRKCNATVSQMVVFASVGNLVNE